MGCNCKRTLNKMEKYSDDYNPSEVKEDKGNILLKILTYILQVGFGILVGCISIFILPFLVIWFVGCIILGKEPTLRLKGYYGKNKPLEISKVK